MNDSCPECLTGPARPHTTDRVGASIAAGYVCTACDHAWSCSWEAASLSPADLRAAARTTRTSRTVT